MVDKEWNLVTFGNTLSHELGRSRLSGIVESTPRSTVRLAQLERFGCCCLPTFSGPAHGVILSQHHFLQLALNRHCLSFPDSLKGSPLVPFRFLIWNTSEVLHLFANI